MVRLLVALLLLALPLIAQESMPADQLALIKRASVMVLVERGEDTGSGSGFLIRVEGTTGYFATNNHVVDFDHGSMQRQRVRREKIQVVFDSGQSGERVVNADVVVGDPEHDLAILRVNDVKALPAPIPIEARPVLSETMPVLMVGFPFGESLASSRRHPSVTINTSTVTSLRRDDAGRIVTVQLGGSNMNPGNSGGPIVTPKGQLVGIAVSSIGTTGIGFAVPSDHLLSLVQGRIGKPAIFAKPLDLQTIQVKVEAPLLDPFHIIQRVRVVCRPAASGERPPMPDADGLWPALGPAPTDAAISHGLATASIRLPRTPAVTLWVQMEYRTAKGLTRTEPIKVEWPVFPAGVDEGRFLTPPRAETRKSATTAAKSTTLLKDVNRSPDRYLGQVVTLDGVLNREHKHKDGKAILGIGFDRQISPENLQFVSASSLADQCKRAAGTEAISVRVIGTLLAPTVKNGAYIIEVDELNLLGSDGTVTASYRPMPVANHPTSPANSPSAELPGEPAEEPTFHGISQGTLLAGAIAVILGGIVGGFVLIKRHARAAAASVPASTVAERLKRRVQ